MKYQFRGKMNEDIDRDRKLFWKKMNKVNGRKDESSSRKRMKMGLELGEDELRRIWKDYLQNLYYMDT